MKTERRYDIDWVRVIGMLLVFVFHCMRFFDDEDWHVKNDEVAIWATAFVQVTWRFMMPLFFVVSAFASYYSLRSRSAGQYLTSRVKRLLVPFLFGTFVVLIPIQVWMERVSHGQYEGSFWGWYPRYFDGWYAFGGNFAWMGLHLWYLEMLFVFAILTLPLFLILSKESMAPFNAKVAAILARPYVIFLFAVPLTLMELWVRRYPESIGVSAFGGWPVFSYLVVFLSGYMLILDPRYRGAIEKSRWVALVLAVAATAILLPGTVTGRSFSMPEGVYYSLNAFTCWFWIFALMGFAAAHLTFSNRFLKYASEAVLPFYILHQTVILIIGFAIRHWQIGPFPKFIFLLVTAFAAIMLLYEGIIRRFNPLRFLFGLRAA
jgi:glucan biosynthesis protein C